MNDQSWYSAQMSGECNDSNPFANEAYRLRHDPALHAHMKRGGSVVAFIKARKDIQSAMASARTTYIHQGGWLPIVTDGGNARSPLQDMEAAISEPGALK